MKMLHGACFPFILALALLIIVGNGSPARSQDSEADCLSAVDRWEQLVQELQEKLSGYQSIQRTPVSEIIQGPLVDRTVNESIAKQVAEAIKIKDGLLNEKRTECKKVLSLENQAFGAVTACYDTGKSSERHKVKRLKAKRNRIVHKARIAIAEVREVEGRDHYPQYVDSWRNQSNYYGRGANDYWRAYQQMYRRYYGR
jgi:hypothetical protein